MMTLKSILGAFGIRWTNTEESLVYLKAERALANPAVWYAVSKISGHIAYLPLNAHRQVDGKIEMPTNHWLYSLLRVQPNAYQTPFVFKRTLMMHALLWGNGYAYIRRNSRRVVELVPLAPDRMIVGLVNGEKVFLYAPYKDERLTLWEMFEQGKAMTFSNEEIFHLQGLGSDGLCGYSLLSLAADAWESGNAADKRTLTQLKKGYAGGVVLQVPEGMLRDPAEAAALLEGWRRDQDGEVNAGKTAMLREGITANVLSMSNRDAQFVDTMVYMRQNEALRFMLETILGDDSSVSYNSAEQKNMAYLQNCLNPWMRLIEEETEVKVMSARMLSQGWYAKVNEKPLLRSDMKTTAEVLGILTTHRIINSNEAREKLDMNPREGGDEYLNPAIDTVDDDDEEEDDNEPAREQPAAATATDIRVKHLFGVEANKVAQKAKRVKYLAPALAKFYDKWEVTLADAFEELNLDRDLATRHCDESKRQLLAVLKTSSDPAADIQACVANWKHRRLQNVTELQC